MNVGDLRLADPRDRATARQPAAVRGRAGRPVVVDGRSWAAVPRPERRRRRPSAGLCRSPSRRTTTAPACLRLPHRPGDGARRSTSTCARRPTSTTPTLPAWPARERSTIHAATTTAASPVRPRRVAVHRHRRRRRRQRPDGTRPEPGDAARQDPAHRPAPGGERGTPDPAGNPFAGDGARVFDRSAQPVALLLRPRHRRPLDRRRRPGPRRGDRLRARSGRRARTTAGAARGLDRHATPRAGDAACGRVHRIPVIDYSHPATTARSPAASWCATPGCRRSSGATSTGTSASGDARALRTARRPRGRRDRREATDFLRRGRLRAGLRRLARNGAVHRVARTARRRPSRSLPRGTPGGPRPALSGGPGDDSARGPDAVCGRPGRRTPRAAAAAAGRRDPERARHRAGGGGCAAWRGSGPRAGRSPPGGGPCSPCGSPARRRASCGGRCGASGWRRR